MPLIFLTAAQHSTCTFLPPIHPPMLHLNGTLNIRDWREMQGCAVRNAGRNANLHGRQYSVSFAGSGGRDAQARREGGKEGGLMSGVFYHVAAGMHGKMHTRLWVRAGTLSYSHTKSSRRCQNVQWALSQEDSEPDVVHWCREEQRDDHYSRPVVLSQRA